MPAPQLDPTATPEFPAVQLDVTDPAGISVADLVVDGSITDFWGGPAPEAIAITRADNLLGEWQYSLDSGASWLDVATIDRTQDIVALLLGPAALIRMVPSGDVTATLAVGLTFVAWDGSTGTSGDYANILQMGGNAPYSWQSNAVAVAVLPASAPVGDEPARRGFVIADVHNSFDFATGLALQSDGDIVVVGESQGQDGSMSSAILAFSSDGSLDTSFAQTGKLVAKLSPYGDQSFDTLLQPDGKILVFGSMGSSFSMSRYDSDGHLDTSFGDGGVVVSGLLFGVPHAALQADGKIVVVGDCSRDTFDAAVLRFNSDGSPDTGFNGTGMVATDFDGLSDVALGVKILPGGGIVVLGSHNTNGDVTLQLSVYHDDGSLDTAFNGTGKVVTALAGDGGFGSCLAVQADGKVVVAGFDGTGATAQLGNLEIVRYDSDGTPDASFGSDGAVTLRLGVQTSLGDLVVQPDGKILFAGSVAGAGGWDFALARFNADGSLDTTFNGTGRAIVDLYDHSDDFAYRIQLLPDGRIVVLGGTTAHGTYDNVVARFTADGQLDTTFGDASTIDYTEGSDATSLEPGGVGVWDPELGALDGGNGNYAGATVTVSRHGGGNADDHFAPTGELSFEGADVVFQGTVVGTLVATAGQIAITFNASATQLRVNGVLTHLAYSNSSDAPPGSVAIDYTLTKGAAGFASFDATSRAAAIPAPNVVGSATVHITAVNDAPTGAVAIAGTPQVDEVLMASNTLADADGLGLVTYAWLADGVPIGGATRSWLVLGADHVGKTISVVASYVDRGGFHESVASTPTAAVLAAGAAADPQTLSGTAASEMLSAGSGNDMLTGLGGNDTLLGLAGRDTLDGGAGNDVLDGGPGSDLYIITATKDHAAAEIDDSGTSGFDELRFSGTGTLKLQAGDTAIERVVIGSGTQAIADASGTKASGVNASAVHNALWMLGNAAANSFTGTLFDDTIDGGAGADRLAGGAGNDTYFVDNARDFISEAASGGTADIIFASVSYTLPSNVEILVLTGDAPNAGTGSAKADIVYGNGAANVINGKGGLDSLDGGEGSDIYLVDKAGDHPGAEFFDSGTTGTDEVRFSGRSGTLVLAAGDTGIERVAIGAGTGAANVDASAVNNGLVIVGNAGANSLKGTSSADTLLGGAGSDTLTGGDGADTFVLDATGGRAGRDTIVDFTHGADVLAVSRAAFTGLAGTGELAAQAFWSAAGATSAHDGDDRIVYNTSTGIVYYDADGAGGAAAVQVALLGTGAHPGLASTDILVIG